MADLFSNLDLDLRHRIYSFLPYKSLVASSTLSKRWEHFWRTYPIFDITDHVPLQRRSISFFDRFILPPPDSDINLLPPIRLMEFNFQDKEISDAIINKWDNWVDALVTRRIETLTLRLNPDRLIPNSLLTCSTVINLKIYMGDKPKRKQRRFGHFHDTPVDLPSLKRLHLDGFMFLNHGKTTRLLNGCMNLEELILNECFMKATNLPKRKRSVSNVYTIRAPNLRRLTICSSRLAKWACGVKVLSDKLEFLSFSCYSWVFVQSDEIFPSLIRAEIELLAEFYPVKQRKRELLATRKNEPQCLENLLTTISKVKELLLPTGSLDIITILRPKIPIFHNLKKLEVGDIDSNCTKFFDLLAHTPNLESLELECTGHFFIDGIEVPDCLRRKLKFVRISKVSGYIEAPVYFLTHCAYLRTIIIEFQTDFLEASKDEVMDQLEGTVKASMFCNIIYV